jgi:hypothetical protein
MALNGTMVKIETVTVGSGGAADVTFSNIPQTYTDLVIKASTRNNDSASTSGSYYIIKFNGSSTSFTNRYLRGNGSAASSATFNQYAGNSVTTGQTASTFSNDEIYIPNYAGSTNKSYSADSVVENNATGAFSLLSAGLWSNTAAITSVTLEAANAGANPFQQYSTFTLYGISGAVTGIKATGGTIYNGTDFVYHIFTTSGTFTPSQTLSCNVLVVAGGGGGGSGATSSSRGAGGGGAGGYLSNTNVSLSSAQTITIGGGGAGAGSAFTNGSAGSNTTFGSLYTAVGGGFGSRQDTNAGSGGSGGGAGNGDIGGVLPAGGAGTAGQGFAGGTQVSSAGLGGCGGGGATSAGGVATTTFGGTGGTGATSEITGVPIVYATGGAGGNTTGATNGATGTANTGNGGGGGNGFTPSLGGTGGSGVVIVRYAK